MDRGGKRESFTSDPPLTDSNNSLATNSVAPSPSLTDSDSRLNETNHSGSPVVEQSSLQPLKDSQTVQNGLKGDETFVHES